MLPPGSDINESNQKSLQQLAWAFETAEDEFQIVLARCNYSRTRDSMMQQLREICTVNFWEIVLQTSDRQLLQPLREQVGREPKEAAKAAIVLGLELVSNLEVLLRATNQARDEFPKYFSHPLVLWTDDRVLEQMSRLAPDFKSWSMMPILFEMPEKELMLFLQETAEGILAAILAEGAIPIRANAAIYRDIQNALADIEKHNLEIDEALEARLQFVLGREEYALGNVEKAMERYETSRKLWEDEEGDSLVIFRAIVRFHIGLCDSRQHDWQSARTRFQECVTTLERAKRQDLAAKFIGQLEEALLHLQNWHGLQELAEKSRQLHQTYNMSPELARDNGFLAEVALRRKKWKEAKKWAKEALALASNSAGTAQAKATQPALGLFPVDAPSAVANFEYRGWYLLLLAKAQRQLKELEAAAASLESARFGDPQENPQLYCQILEELRKVYWQQKRYRDASGIKQERRSIQQQFGLRAFLGARRLQPQQQQGQTELAREQGAALSPEILLWGREEDVRKLTERIRDIQRKLTVIYGQSGVGKSSLLSSALIPHLKSVTVKAGDTLRDLLPVMLQVYRNWTRDLGQELAAALAERNVRLSAVPDTAASIREQLEKNDTERHLFTVLIFDQLEEFFFVDSAPVKTREFFSFILNWLNLPYVYVILCLREDYLHYLLPWNDGENMKAIGKNILHPEILYPLGNLTPKRAKKLMDELSQRSELRLELSLIEEMVQDMAAELGEEVRPIELQIVGAQMETEGIEKVEDYWRFGGKQALVKQYLIEALEDCGPENEEVAELVLYLLVNQNNTRPLKARTDLELDRLVVKKEVQPEQLQLVLDILVQSGLVLQVPETPENRYQLVHDYLAAAIRRLFDPKLSPMAEKLAEETEERRRLERRLERILIEQEIAQKEAERERTRDIDREIRVVFKELERAAAVALQRFESSQLDALLDAVRMAKKLQAVVKDGRGIWDYLAISPIYTLQQILDGIWEKNRLEGHTASVNSVSFSPNGELIATASDDNIARIWDKGGRLVRRLSGHSNFVNSVSFSPNGELIATASADYSARIWDKRGNLLQKLEHSDWVNSASFSPDGKFIATASARVARIWDRGGNLLHELTGHTDWVWGVSFSPDGELIATASADRTARIWDRSGNLLRQLTQHSDWVNSVSFSPDGEFIATASYDRTARIWDRGGNLLRELTGHNDWVNSVSFSPDGELIATASKDGTARIWDKGGNLEREFTGHSDWVNNVSFSPDGEFIATASDDCTARIWDKGSNRAPQLTGHTGSINSLSFSADGELIATASDDRTARIWDRGRNLAIELIGHTGSVNSVSFSPNGELIATASDDNTARIWDNSGTLVQLLTGHTGSVNSVSFSPDGELIATASDDRTAIIWDRSGNLLQLLTGHSGSVNSVSFSPDGELIATASDDRTARIWDRGKNMLEELTGHTGSVNSACFSADGELIATASDDRTARTWDRRGNWFQKLTGHTDRVHGVSFSPDGKFIVTASSDFIARIWDRRGNLLQELIGHIASVNSVRFSPDSKSIATASDDGTVRLWSVDLDALLARACDWLRDYLETNPNITESDRSLCL